MNYSILLKTILTFYLVLYVSVAYSQLGTVITITVGKDGEVTIVREPSKTPIDFENISENDTVIINWECRAWSWKVMFQYSNGIITYTRIEPIPPKTKDLPYTWTFDEYKAFLNSYIDEVKKILQLQYGCKNRSRREGSCEECSEPELSVKVISFATTIKENTTYLEWITGTEKDNVGFRLWRAIKEQYTDYRPTLLREFGNSEQVNPEPNENCSTKIQGQLKADNSTQFPELISAIGNSVESTCYSFTDTSDLSNGTYYYLLEDIGDNGDSTFHCDQIDTVTIGQGPAIDLESAINYCKEVTGSND